jgi:hypothetical protein
MAKKSPKYICNFCNYICYKKYDYIKHVDTKKHKSKENTNNTDGTILTNCDFLLSNKIYRCNCGNKYKHRQSLFNHKKKCSNIEKNENIVIKKLELNTENLTKLVFNVVKDNNQDNKINNTIINKDEIIMELLQQNKELIKLFHSHKEDK